MIVGGVSLSVLGFQQSANWGWGNPWTVVCIVVGVALLVAFALVELRTASPLMQVRIFRIRAFAAENLVLGISMLVFVPMFFFASEYAQIALGKSGPAGRALPALFLPRLCGHVADRWAHPGSERGQASSGHRCALAAVGFGLWAGRLTQLDFSNQVWPVILAGAGMGFMLTPASTDAVNRASGLSYGEATGITQTVRNYAATLGFAVLGTILVTQLRSRVSSSLVAQGVSPARASAEASRLGQAQGSGASASNIPHFYRVDFAYASRTVFYIMAGIMAVAAVVALLGLEPGRQELASEPAAQVGDLGAGDPVQGPRPRLIAPCPHRSRGGIGRPGDRHHDGVLLGPPGMAQARTPDGVVARFGQQGVAYRQFDLETAGDE